MPSGVSTKLRSDQDSLSLLGASQRAIARGSQTEFTVQVGQHGITHLGEEMSEPRQRQVRLPLPAETDWEPILRYCPARRAAG